MVVVEDAATAVAVAAAAAAEAEADVGSRRTATAPRAGERSIVDVVVVIVVVEDDLLGAPPSCPRIRSRTLGRHQILFASHRTTARNDRPDVSRRERDFYAWKRSPSNRTIPASMSRTEYFRRRSGAMQRRLKEFSSDFFDDTQFG